MQYPIQVIDHINSRRNEWLAKHVAPVGPRPRSAAKTKLGASPNIAGLIVIPVSSTTKLILGAPVGPFFYSLNFPTCIYDPSADRGIIDEQLYSCGKDH
jgi:hypothetical protein